MSDFPVPDLSVDDHRLRWAATYRGSEHAPHRLDLFVAADDTVEIGDMADADLLSLPEYLSRLEESV